MEGAVDIPGNGLRKFFREPGDPIARPHFAGRIADDKNAAGRDPFGKPRQQCGLGSLREIMQDVEERDIAVKIRQPRFDVLKSKFHVAITAGRNGRAALDLSRVQVQPKDRLTARALAQIKGQSPTPQPTSRIGSVEPPNKS
jgi:hypothetical protein